MWVSLMRRQLASSDSEIRTWSAVRPETAMAVYSGSGRARTEVLPTEEISGVRANVCIWNVAVMTGTGW